MTAAACGRCLSALEMGIIRREGVQPLRGGGMDALSLDKLPHCQDCDFAETMVRLGHVPSWEHARTAMSNHRQESLRLPGVKIGLGMVGARTSEEGEFDKHHDWLDEVVPEDLGEEW
jgi:hypothetical protein